MLGLVSILLELGLGRCLSDGELVLPSPLSPPAVRLSFFFSVPSYRQCCSGRELVDAILGLGFGVHSRSQAVGICQVLLDEDALCHGEPEPSVGHPGLGSLGEQASGGEEEWASQWGLIPTQPQFPLLCHAWASAPQ